MKRFRSVCLIVVVAGIIVRAPFAFGGGYTAKALIEVLPYAEKDPFVLETPPIDKDLQYQFRSSIATLMTTQSVFENLLMRDAVRKTRWYRQEAGKLPSGIMNLQKNLRVVAQEKSNFIEVSMTCEDAGDAADIANEMVSMFISLQADRAQANIAAKLQEVTRRRSKIQAELDSAFESLNNMRLDWKLSTLGLQDYPHPITVRLIRLEEVKDSLSLEIKGLEATIDFLNKAGKSSEDKKLELAVLHGKLTAAAKMCKEAKAKQKDLDVARIYYAQRVHIRDERIKMLNETKMLIEKLTILHDDPDTVKVRMAIKAVKPVSRDS